MVESEPLAIDDTAIDAEDKKIVTFSMTPQLLEPDSWLTDYDGLFYNDDDDYWEPPIDRNLLANLTRRNAQHGGIVQSRANMAASRFVSGGMKAEHIEAAFLNIVQFGDIALLKIRNGFGQVVRLFPVTQLPDQSW